VSDATIETLSRGGGARPAFAGVCSQANAQPEIYGSPFEELWEREGRERVSWFEPFTSLYEWELPYAKWYLGGKLNVTYNCVDRHVEAGQGGKVAFYWEGEPGDRREVTFAHLLEETTKLANALKALGVRKGTPVGIYMGMVPETPIAMLACARIGAPHTVVFGGFSADSLRDRLQDMECEVLITQDEAWRRGQTVPLKATADEALAESPSVRSCVVLRRTGGEVPMTEGRDVWWHEVATVETECPCEPMDSEDLLYLLYTSGTTAKPKGIVHTTAGYLVGTAATHRYIFDVKPDTVYWCAADVGWVTGHSYIVYGPLCNGTTGVMYEGTPDFPDKDRWWEIAERYGSTCSIRRRPRSVRT
jgi:acetyl-CoA synthetase